MPVGEESASDAERSANSSDVKSSEPSLLGLPPEMRLVIYQYALPLTINLSTDSLPFPAIRAVNLLLRAEALKPFLKDVVFIYDIAAIPSFAPLASWLRLLGRCKLELVSRLEIHLNARRTSSASVFNEYWRSFEELLLPIFREWPDTLEGKLVIRESSAGLARFGRLGGDVGLIENSIGMARREGQGRLISWLVAYEHY